MLEYQIFKFPNEGEKCWRWRLTDDSREIACAKDAHLKGECLASIKRIRQELSADLLRGNECEERQNGDYHIQRSQSDKDGKWYWRLFKGDCEIAVSSEGFISEDSLKIALERIGKETRESKITWEHPEDDPAYQEKHDDRTETRGVPGS